VIKSDGLQKTLVSRASLHNNECVALETRTIYHFLTLNDLTFNFCRPHPDVLDLLTD
jgi:hypothetical protein